MRLLNTTTKRLESFYDKNIPRYAILSHMWGKEEDEVLFHHIVGSDDARHEGESRKGYAKIVGACKQAIEDEWEYIWIDTCCINKESSAELSEAINSMYQWYQRAEVCYVYLEDVRSNGHGQNSPGIQMGGNDGDSPFKIVPFECSRWFTRGWTLQELIAPQDIVFYSKDWIDIGTKASLRDIISARTRIRVEILMAHDPRKASVAERMSWGTFRETKRKEDIAYCLMGLFGVNMPLLYGEGNRAFKRLQEEIMKVSDDHSLFAWKDHFNNRHSGFQVGGMLADSPWNFRDGMDIVPSDDGAYSPYSMTNQGLQIQLPLQPIDPKRDLINIDSDISKNVFKATLKCTIRDKQPAQWIVIYLKMIREGYYQRIFLHWLDETEISPNKNELISLLVPQVDTSMIHHGAPGIRVGRIKALPTDSGFTTKGHSLVEGYEDPSPIYITDRPEVLTFNGPGGKFAVVTGVHCGVFWLDIVDVTNELWVRDYEIRKAYEEGGYRHDMVLRYLDRLSVMISNNWSVAVSTRKSNSKDREDRFGSPNLCITIDIQRVPTLARGWYTPSPTSTSDNFDLKNYLDGHYVVHTGFRKERSDWVAVFNPKVGRTLDISPMRSIVTYPSALNSFGISRVRFSPDGKYLAMGYESTIRIYDTNTGAEIHLFNELYNVPICFSPDGKFFATGTNDGEIKFWDTEKGHTLKVLSRNQYIVESLCFSPDSRLMVSGSDDGTIQIWDIAEETSEILTMDGPESLRSISVSRNGRLVAAGGRKGTAQIWDITTAQLVKKLEGYEDFILDVVFTTDGKGLLVGGAHGLDYWDVREPLQVMGTMEGSNGTGPVGDPRASGMFVQGESSQRTISKHPVSSVAISHDGHWVISASHEGSVQFWNLKNMTMQFMLRGHNTTVTSIDMSPVDNIFATSSSDGSFRIWRYGIL